MPGSDDPKEAGATLILVLVFLVAIALTVSALATSATDNLKVATNLTAQRGLEYGAMSALEVATQDVRYNFAGTCPSSVAVPSATGASRSFNLTCQVTQTSQTVNGATVTRQATIYVCTSGICSSSNWLGTAQLNLYDYVNFVNRCSAMTNASCGAGMTVVSWIVGTAND
ncbi:MAG: hypothetical protein ACYDA2_10360 [Acidimicrobiales bacterium]